MAIDRERRYVGALCAFVLAMGAACGPERTAQPNVVLIALDTLRADLMSPSNAAVMPNLHALAGESLYFSRATSPSSWTKPAMASILTSLPVRAHGVWYGSLFERKGSAHRALPASLATIPTLFQQAGYSTAAVQTNPHLVGAFGFDRGFDRFEYLKPASDGDEFGGYAPADAVTTRAISVIDELDRPFLAYVHYLDAHVKYWPPVAYRAAVGERFGAADSELRANDGTYFFAQRLSDDYRPPPPRAQSITRALYDAEARHLDRELGRLLRHIDSLDRGTIVVVVSDHGEEFWEHGNVSHAFTVFEELVHVPMIVRIPGVEPARIDARVSTLDVLPTLAARLGLPVSADWRGVDLLGHGGAERTVFSETYGLNENTPATLAAAIQGSFKYVRDAATGTQWLYDLDADPAELVDVSDRHPAVLERLRALLLEHEAESERFVERHAIDASSQDHELDVDPELMDALKALGYIGS